MEMQTIKQRLRKLALPAVVSAAGGAIGLLLSRPQKQLRQSLPDEMRERLDAVLGKDSQPQETSRESLNTDDLEKRRAERRKRREQRKRRLRA
jgi:hypothetical protein